MSMGRDPGDFREEVTILEPSGRARDGLGGQSGAGTYAALAADSQEYADITPVGARRRENAQAAGEPVTYDVTLRHRTDLTTANRLLWTNGPQAPDTVGSESGILLILVGGPVNRDSHGEFLTFTAREDK